MAKSAKTIIKLRRDTLSNYINGNRGQHIPAVGEVCLVETLSRGVRMKVGDGVKSFLQLPFLDEDNPAVVLGYLYNGKFYKDYQHTKEITEFGTNVIYIDIPSSIIYYYDGTDLKASKVDIPSATAEKAGVVKLYDTHGQNTDGTMSQKAITDAIDAIKLDVSEDASEKVLELAKPW